MRLHERLRPELVLIAPPVRDREELFGRLAAALAAVEPGVSPEAAVAALAEREAILSTGVGNGVAVPHAQLRGLPGLVLAASTHPEGIEYPSLDGVPVRLVFCILAPPEAAADHLACLARVARVARRRDRLAELAAAPSPEAFLERLAALETEV